MLHAGGFSAAGARDASAPTGVVRWSYQAPSPGELPGVELLREGSRAELSAKLRPFGKEKKKRTADRRAEQEGSEYEQ